MALWRAKQATIEIGPFIAAVSSSTALDDQMSGSAVDWSGKIKNISISGAEADVDSVFLFGADAAGRQNADIEESNMTMREFTATLVYLDESIAELATTTGSAVGSTGFTRVQGDTTRTKKAVLVTLDDGANQVNILLNNAYFTKIGDIKLDAEGHAEQEVMCKCLAKDYFEESDFS